MTRVGGGVDRRRARIFRALAAPERRYVLDYLRRITGAGTEAGTEQDDGETERNATVGPDRSPVTVEALAEYLSGAEDTTSWPVERYRFELHHRHLPILDDNTTIRYDWRARHVDYAPDPFLEGVLDALDVPGDDDG